MAMAWPRAANHLFPLQPILCPWPQGPQPINPESILRATRVPWSSLWCALGQFLQESHPCPAQHVHPFRLPWFCRAVDGYLQGTQTWEIDNWLTGPANVTAALYSVCSRLQAFGPHDHVDARLLHHPPTPPLMASPVAFSPVPQCLCRPPPHTLAARRRDGRLEMPRSAGRSFRRPTTGGSGARRQRGKGRHCQTAKDS